MTIGIRSSAHYYLLILFLIWFSSVQLKAQDDAAADVKQLGGDGYREGQYPGLGRAASQIFYSPNTVTFSGYAELANVFNGGEIRDISSGDLELYFNQLYRITPFIGVKLSKKLFLTTELGIEYLEGNNESHFYFFPEIYLDIIYKSEISFRVGMQPLNIGYINNNEEPLLFLSVNRPETERLIIPSEWIEVGITAYGEFFDKINYFFSVTNGVLGKNFESPTWIRGGAEGQLESFNKIALNAQLNYLPAKSLTLSLSGYYNQSGRDEEIIMDGISKKVAAPLGVLSGYARWDYKGFSVIGLGASGILNETNELYYLTAENNDQGEVIGEKAFGFYFEPSFDILRLFKSTSNHEEKQGKIFTIHNSSLPVFIRYELLDTHSSVDSRLVDYSYIRNNLKIWMIGFNYKPNHNFVAKFNVKFSENLDPAPEVPAKETLYELGIGIEF